MKMISSFSTSVALLFVASSAFALPSRRLNHRQMEGMTMEGITMAAGTSATPAANATGNGTSAQACAEGAILAQGIALNIADQKNEAAALAKVKTLLAATSVDMTAFMSAKSDLVSFVNKGIAIRQMNQLITPVNNAATEGLAIVANAQLMELELSTALTGVPATDSPNVAKLEMGFSGGTMQNMMNQAAAMQGCSQATSEAPSPPTASSAPRASTTARASSTAPRASSSRAARRL